MILCFLRVFLYNDKRKTNSTIFDYASINSQQVRNNDMICNYKVRQHSLFFVFPGYDMHL